MDTYIPCAFVNNFVLFRHTCTHLIFSLDKQTLFTSTHLYMYHFFFDSRPVLQEVHTYVSSVIFFFILALDYPFHSKLVPNKCLTSYPHRRQVV